ncbi:MAG: hypothetical protein WD512_03525 [Candidatus Paceibacterota bacterium]
MKENKVPDDQLISLSEFREFMFSAIVPIIDIKDCKGEAISILLPYWRRHRLLPFFQKGKWSIEISFAQFMWLRVLDSLRDFGFSIIPMERVCEYFFKDAYNDDLPKKNLLANKNLLDAKVLNNTSTEDDEKCLREINGMLEDELLLYGLKFDINYFSKLITDSIAIEVDAGFLVFSNGDVIEYLGENYFSHRKKDLDISKPHIRLSVKYFLQEFINTEDLQKLFMPTMLNANEKEVLKALRMNNTSITIKKQDGKIVNIVSTNEGTISDTKAKEIREILGLRNYEEITISTRDDKTLTFKKTKKNNRLR